MIELTSLPRHLFSKHDEPTDVLTIDALLIQATKTFPDMPMSAFHVLREVYSRPETPYLKTHLERICGLPRSTVERAVKLLAELGLVALVKGGKPTVVDLKFIVYPPQGSAQK